MPSEVFLAIRKNDNRLVGIIDYKHPLTDFLLKYGGSIGYSILPSQRGNGYASMMLNKILPICREYGDKRVLLTCEKSNIASRKSIIKNGGILEDEVENDVCLGSGDIIQRYWISTDMK